MALSVSDILQVSAPAAMYAAGRANYRLDPVHAVPDRPQWYAVLIDQNTWEQVAIIWSRMDELEANTEAKKIALVETLLQNAIRVLDNRLTPEVFDVTFE